MAAGRHQRLTEGTSESDTPWTVTAASRTSPSSSRAQSWDACMVLVGESVSAKLWRLLGGLPEPCQKAK